MIKTLKTAAIVVAVVIMSLIVTSCSRSPSNSSVFKKIAAEKGYVIYNVTAQYINAPQIKEAFIAAEEDKNIQIEFYSITDRESAMELYQIENDVIESYQGEAVESKVSNGKNYARRAVIAENGNYLLVSYIENTVIYVPPTSRDNQETIEEFIDKLGY